MSDFVEASESQKRVETVKEINQRVDLKIKQTPTAAQRFSPGALGGKLPGIPLPDDFDKTMIRLIDSFIKSGDMILAE